MLEFLILQGNSQNRNMVYMCFRMKYSLPSCLTLAINHTTNYIYIYLYLYNFPFSLVPASNSLR